MCQNIIHLCCLTTLSLICLSFLPSLLITWCSVTFLVMVHSGKLGALVGSFLFEPASDMWGVGPVLVICAGISLAGTVQCGVLQLQPFRSWPRRHGWELNLFDRSRVVNDSCVSPISMVERLYVFNFFFLRKLLQFLSRKDPKARVVRN